MKTCSLKKALPGVLFVGGLAAWGMLSASHADQISPQTQAFTAVSIGVFSDSEATQGIATIVPFTPTTLYLRAILYPASYPPFYPGGTIGMIAAEFQVVMTPPLTQGQGSITYNAPPNALTSSGGNFGATSRWWIAFDACQTGINRVVDLGTITLFSFVNLPATTLQVRPSPGPMNGFCNGFYIAQCEDPASCGSASPRACASGLQFGLNGAATGSENLVPAVYRLHPNRPNPFNPSTTIAYDLPEASPVRLEIFDVAGRRVRLLLATPRASAGTHETVWDGRNDLGETVGTGIYFYRLQAGPYVESARMTLVK